jgi:carboxymethylenebutenolidase
MRELNQFEDYLVHEFVDDYHEGQMSRRDLVGRVLHISGGVASAAAVLSSLGVAPLTASAQQASPAASSPAAVATPTGPRSPLSVAADDPRIAGEDITFPGKDGATIMAYQARPSAQATPGAAGKWPVVLVCHENRGLTDHIRDVTRRWAVEGYVACAVDLLSRQGGTAAIADPAQIPALLTNGDPMRHVADFQAAAAFYGAQSFADAARLGMNGFCFGGGITWLCTTQMPELKGSAPYYGPPPPLDQVPNIKAAVFAVYSSDPNDFANKGRDELKQALEAAHVTFEFKVYPGTKHAFNNDTGPNWNRDQSIAAWRDVQAWFTKYVKS